MLTAIVLTMTATALAIPQTPEQEAQLVEALKYRWELHARPSQLEPEGDWSIWLLKTGRGWGKTRTAGEWVCKQVRSGRCGLMHLVAATAADARDTMVEGESGILAISPNNFRPNYEPSKRRLTWPNGAQATLFSAEEPDRLRGPQCDGWWADELAAWKYITEAWDQLQLGARLGSRPRGAVTTTPRPVKLLKELVKRDDVYVTHGHTLDNAKNLAASYIASVQERYGGTRLGRQELAGEILDDNPNALWRRQWIDAPFRITRAEYDKLDIARVVTALDPSGTSGGDEAGIITGARDSQNPPHFYVLADDTLQGSPEKWARATIKARDDNHADKIVYESNFGGEMVPLTLRTVDKYGKFDSVHASRGKAVRAEPISALAEQGRIHHVGNFPLLEDELCEWEPGGASPNRLDALVWAMTDLSGKIMPQIINRASVRI